MHHTTTHTFQPNITLLSCCLLRSPTCSALPSPSPSTSPAPQPKLALISEFPAGYNDSSANLTATGTNNANCVEAPSSVMGHNGVSIEDPGPGFCGTDGSMPASNYTLGQTAPPGVVFQGWECYEITDDVPRPIAMATAMEVPLNTNEMVTCVAIYVLASSPSPPPLPKLGLASNFPPDWSGPSANLTARGPLVDCVEAPSPIIGTNNVSIVAPGAGLCGIDGSVPSGPYNLTQVAPPGVRFDGWQCYDVEGNASVMIGTDPNVLLEGTDQVTCVANYVTAEGTCADALPAVPDVQQYNCSRPTMMANSSAGMMSPATDGNCCMVSGVLGCRSACYIRTPGSVCEYCICCCMQMACWQDNLRCTIW
jgi:hypothetical protein